MRDDEKADVRKTERSGQLFERIVIKAFCVMFMTLIVDLALVHVMVYAESLESVTGGMVRAFDSAGHEVDFDEEHDALIAGPVRFIFDRDKLKEGESYLYEDGSTLNPVENDEYIIFPDSGIREVSFYRKTAGGETIRLHGGRIGAEFTEGIYEKPAAYITEKDGDYIITVMPLRYSNVYCEIRGPKNGSLEEIRERTEFRLSEDGIYNVSVYAEDGMGHRAYADIPGKVSIDKTPPVLEETVLPALISRERMILPLKAHDGLSGVEGIYVMTGNDEPHKADIIEVDPPFKGSIYYMAKDNAGNLTERRCLGENVIVDDEPPVINAEAVDINERSLSLTISASDDTAGVKKVTIASDKKVLYSGTGTRDRVTIDLSAMKYGSGSYVITASDNAGNTGRSFFVVEKKDGIPPVLNIRGVSDRGVYGRDVRLYFEASDDAGRDCAIREKVMRYSLSGEYEGSDEYEEDSLFFEKSGVYIIKASAMDEAGNTSERSTAFAIDKDAPVIRGLSGLQGSVLKSFVMPADDSIAEDESLVRVKVMLNGMDYDGEEVTRSGRYSLQVLAMDEFGNTSSGEARFEVNM